MSNELNEIKRDASANRELLARSLSQLSTALSPERIAATVSREAQERGGTVGKTAIDVARANPAGALLVSLGVATLAFGPKKPKAPAPYDTRNRPTAKGFSGKEPLSGEFDARVAAADAAMKETPKAPQMRAALMKGLANLPEPARKRVIKAREAAIDAQDKIDRHAARAARKAQSFHQRQPLATGAVAIGVGALVAALLPRTRTEDRLMGAHRDTLMQQAELTLRDELANATATGEAALRDSLDAGIERIQRH